MSAFIRAQIDSTELISVFGMVWSSYLDIVKVNDPILAADRDRTLFVGFILGLNFEVVIIIDFNTLPRSLA